MVKVVPELRQELIGRNLWSAFVAACERRAEDGVKGENAIRDDAIDEVCPDLARFKRRKAVRKFAAEIDERERFENDASCNFMRTMKWVIDNYERRNDVSENEAPSSEAWAYLRACARDEGTYVDVVLKPYAQARMKLDAAQGDTDTRKIDGQREYDILENLKLEIVS